jgi:putative acetyltransferase
MTAPITIQAERPDHPQVVTMLDELDAYLATLYAPEDVYILDVQALLAQDVTFLTARQGQVLLGCGAMRRMPGEVDTQGERYGEIKRMFVRPMARGQRIAERLLAQLEATLVAEGIRLSLLETGPPQTHAIRLYERCGYAPRGPFGGYPESEASLFYAKRL